MTAAPLDVAWLRDHPLPAHDGETDKNSRGRVLAAGGTVLVPGALRLTGEAALRAGAGKLQMATVAPAALLLGMLVPEAAVLELPADDAGEIAPSGAGILIAAMARCDAFVLGPGMGDRDCAAVLVEALLAQPRDGLHTVLDAAACACAGGHRDLLRRHGGRIVFTPHHGEMAGLTGEDVEAIAADPERAAQDAADHFGAVVVLKAARTVIASADAEPLVYPAVGSGSPPADRATSLPGSSPGCCRAARARSKRRHGACGSTVRPASRLAERIGAIGFLARELLPKIPTLMRVV